MKTSTKKRRDQKLHALTKDLKVPLQKPHVQGKDLKALAQPLPNRREIHRQLPIGARFEHTSNPEQTNETRDRNRKPRTKQSGKSKHQNDLRYAHSLKMFCHMHRLNRRRNEASGKMEDASTDRQRLPKENLIWSRTSQSRRKSHAHHHRTRRI
jgi:hypothetical protein